MYITKEKFNEIKSRYGLTIFTDDDAEAAFNFVRDILEAEADALKENCPYATVSIRDIEKAAYEVFEMSSDISSGEFGDEG